MKVTLTCSEAVEMLKNAYYPSYLSINENVELEIEPDVTSVVTDDNPWIDVPKDWKEWSCPHEDFGRIQVCYRNNRFETGDSDRWSLAWKQKDHQWDIVQYRQVNE